MSRPRPKAQLRPRKVGGFVITYIPADTDEFAALGPQSIEAPPELVTNVRRYCESEGRKANPGEVFASALGEWLEIMTRSFGQSHPLER